MIVAEVGVVALTGVAEPRVVVVETELQPRLAACADDGTMANAPTTKNPTSSERIARRVTM